MNRNRSLSMDIRREDGTAVVALHGSFGILQVGQIDRSLDELSAGGPPRILLDLSDVDAVGALAAAAAAASFAHRHRWARVELLLPSRAVLDGPADSHFDELAPARADSAAPNRRPSLAEAMHRR